MACHTAEGPRLLISAVPAVCVSRRVVSTRSSVALGKRDAARKLYRYVNGDIRYGDPGNATQSNRYPACGHCGAQSSSSQYYEFSSVPLMSSQLGCELFSRFFQNHDIAVRERFNLRIRGTEGKSSIRAGGRSARNGHQPQVSGNMHRENTDRLLWTSTQSEKRIFIFGIGFASSAFAGCLLENNWIVSGTCRSDAKKALLEQWGCRVHIFDSDSKREKLRDGALRELQQASHWLVSVPPVVSDNVDPILRSHWRDLEEAVKLGRVEWIGYLSSTGVYGDWQGKWVDEESEPRPVAPRAVARLTAEKAWLKFGLDNGVFVNVFRLGGVYGPGRSALDAISRDALSERQRRREQQRYTARIHVADICQAVFASMRNPCPGRIYNVVDDDPAPRATVLDYAQNLVDGRSSNSGCYASIEQSSGGTSGTVPIVANAASQIAEKRVSNHRLKVELQVQLMYPSYKSGLDAIFEAASNNSG